MRGSVSEHHGTTLAFATMYAAFAATNGAAFAPSPHFRGRHRPRPSPRARQANDRTHRTLRGSATTRSDVHAPETNRDPRPMSKVRSPSNSYTQFYKEGVLVGLERTSSKSRRISGEIFVDAPIDNLWDVITDYDGLSARVPNLVESAVVNADRIGGSAGERPRVYQRGAQRIFGFQFGADVTLDMSERVHRGGGGGGGLRSVEFDCVDSQFFSQFDGSWVLEECANGKTMVQYIVDVRPKGPVPVAALEWRIKEDVPVNILAVSRAAQSGGARRKGEGERSIVPVRQQEDPPPQPERRPPHRLPRPPAQNPLQQLNDQSTQMLKRTAKAFLPTSVISTARQVIDAFSGPNPMAEASSDAFKTERESDPPKEIIVDWYEDETMAAYL